RTPAGTAAAHASVATAVAGHDAAAEAAAGGVSHVDHAGERVGGVDGSGFRLLASGLLATDSASRLPTPSGVPPAGRSLRLSNSSCCWPVRKRSWSQRKM